MFSPSVLEVLVSRYDRFLYDEIGFPLRGYSWLGFDEVKDSNRDKGRFLAEQLVVGVKTYVKTNMKVEWDHPQWVGIDNKRVGRASMGMEWMKGKGKTCIGLVVVAENEMNYMGKVMMAGWKLPLVEPRLLAASWYASISVPIYNRLPSSANVTNETNNNSAITTAVL